MKDKNYRFNMILFVLFALVLILAIGCSKSKRKISEEKKEIPEQIEEELNNEIAVKKPPFTDGIFPCTECHNEMENNPVRRELFMHEEIDKGFDHDKESRWCLDCHYFENRDSIKLASGKLLGFDESYKLCGQCHGDKLRDWRVGVHGKRTGNWNGEKKYYLCIHCHDPHSPKFKPIKPEPAPVGQEDIN